MSQSTPRVIKIILLDVGKSSMMVKYTSGRFDPSIIATIGLDNAIKRVTIEGEEYLLKIWDTAGQEKFRAITNSFIRSAHGVILIFDITNRKSFENIEYWLSTIKKNGLTGIRIVLAGNKTDLSGNRVVSTEELEEFATKNEVPYFESSAVTGQGLDEIFISSATLYLNNPLGNQKPTENPVIQPQPPLENKTENKCCDF